ncbi:MAG TPA: hypothetical protein ENI42_01110, partial [Thermoplasmatales archaeon]|nr:hypothetical protein [Thermoplasmatales archaeon]
VDDEKVRVCVDEASHYLIYPSKPVLPVNVSVVKFGFGTKIVDVEYNVDSVVVYDLSCRLPFGGRVLPDVFGKMFSVEENKSNVVTNLYPGDWISYHAGGGLSLDRHVTFFVLNVYPVRYDSVNNSLFFVNNVTVTVRYREPDTSHVGEHSIYDLLVIAPSRFCSILEPFVEHKNLHSVKTRLVSLEEVYDRMFWYGRDNAEKIKYFIKNAVEYWGVTYVLLVGGMRGQTGGWYLPVRYSHVVPFDEQEYDESSFISDLYYADVYDGDGNFSSWDSNNNGVFAEWNETVRDDMDLYPDVYLGRLPCRSVAEVKTMVKKIIAYEKDVCEGDWFNNFLVVAGDSYNDTEHFNEGELIGEAAIQRMPGFNPVRVYASEQDINRKTVNKALNKGCGFAYFCGHGSPMSWNTHFPSNGTEWCTGYELKDMLLLHNGRRLPVVVVGGCHNAQFDVTLLNILRGLRDEGLSYFRVKPPFGGFWYGEWSPECWAWFLTSKRGGGAIATVANTGLGTHGEGDVDGNGVPDYLEVLDGWLELRFFQLYGVEGVDVLGEIHGETLTGYLHKFLGNDERMDVKMVQQWELFGDPSLRIGGRRGVE